jgi:hypothetical protein
VVERLEAQQLIHARETVREGRRPERTIYESTDSGRREMVDWLTQLITNLIAAFAFLTAFAFAFAWLFITIGLAAKTPQAANGYSLIVFPLCFRFELVRSCFVGARMAPGLRP